VRRPLLLLLLLLLLRNSSPSSITLPGTAALLRRPRLAYRAFVSAHKPDTVFY